MSRHPPTTKSLACCIFTGLTVTPTCEYVHGIRRSTVQSRVGTLFAFLYLVEKIVLLLGESLHRELELLVVAGLSTIDALRAATSLPAKHFGLSDRGIIAPGHRADLVLIADDPIADISATRSIQRVWCGGMEISIPPVTLLRGMRSRVSRIMASVGIFGFRIVMNIARMCGVLPKGLSH